MAAIRGPPAARSRQVAGLRVADGDGRIAVHQQGAERRPTISLRPMMTARRPGDRQPGAPSRLVTPAGVQGRARTEQAPQRAGRQRPWPDRSTGAPGSIRVLRQRQAQDSVDVGRRYNHGGGPVLDGAGRRATPSDAGLGAGGDLVADVDPRGRIVAHQDRHQLGAQPGALLLRLDVALDLRADRRGHGLAIEKLGGHDADLRAHYSAGAGAIRRTISRRSFPCGRGRTASASRIRSGCRRTGSGAGASCLRSDGRPGGGSRDHRSGCWCCCRT